jgi:uncharacterized membrane protein SpoIIM required for sporulation
MNGPAPAKAGFRLRSFEFRREREASWRELEDLVKRVEKRGLQRLDAHELQRLPTLYRSVLSSLSVARAISLDKNVTQYLEALSSRAYFAIYCRRRFLGHTMLAFFRETFPQSLRRIRWAFLLATSVFLLGVTAGFVLTEDDPTRFYSFVDEGMAGPRGPDSSREDLMEVLYTKEDSASALTSFATFLFTHNARIGLLCFAVGFVAGVPVLLVLFANGTMLGAMWAIHAAKGLGGDFIAWVLPHGVTELLAVIICGAAGLSMGYGLVFPGRFRRLDNLAIRGRHAGSLAVGAVFLFFVAALIEGVFRQLVTDVPVRVAVIAATLALWVAYFTLAGRGARLGQNDPAEHLFAAAGASAAMGPEPERVAR